MVRTLSGAFEDVQRPPKSAQALCRGVRDIEC